VAGNKVGIAQPNQVRGADFAGTKAQVGNGHRTGFLGVIHKVTLCAIFSLLTNDLDRVFVGAHGTIGAQAKEHAALDIRGSNAEGGVVGKAGVGKVIVNAHGKVVLGFGLGKFFKYRLDHGGRKFLGGKTIPTTNDNRHGFEGGSSCSQTFRKRGDYIHVQGFTCRTGFLAAIENSNGPGCGWQCFEEMLHGKRSVEVNCQNADLLALANQVFGGFLGSLSTRAHDDDHAFRIRCANIIKQVILPTNQSCKFIHLRLNDGGELLIIRINCFASLEVHVRVLGGTAQYRVIGRETPVAMRQNQVIINHGTHIIHGDLLNLVDFVRCAESIKEMQDRDAPFQCSCLGNQCHILGFLGGTGA